MVVRYSECGKYLATGSDDRTVVVWERVDDDNNNNNDDENDDDNNDNNNDNNNNNNNDNKMWRFLKRLEGHDGDVQALAWSPDSLLLVTAGLDSRVVVWSVPDFGILHQFDMHHSAVKGVSFDPANQYFATASDDRTLKIVRCRRGSTTTFAVEATITAPFKGSPSSTYFRRCSWSPDGNHIAAANATNLPLATVTIINRGTWDSDISLVGHEAPCEAAAFCPRIFCLDQYAVARESAEYKSLISVIATAGQDKTLAIWNTSNPRPLLVATNVAEKDVTDVAWSPEGDVVYACSLDGSIVAAVFKPGELGWGVPLEVNKLQLGRYQDVDPTPTDPVVPEPTPTDPVIPPTIPPVIPSVIPPVIPPTVTLTKEGKKRIAPILISTPPADTLPKAGVPALVVGPKRRGDVLAVSGSETQYLRQPVAAPGSAVAQLRLGVPRVQTFFARAFNNNSVESTLEMRNASDGQPSKVVVTRAGSVLFTDYLPGAAVLAAGSVHFWAVATADGSVYVYSPAGRRLFPALVVGAPLSHLESEGSMLVAISAVGLVYVWELGDVPRAVFEPVSLAPVFDAGSKYGDDGLVRCARLTHAGVTGDGQPYVTLSSGDSFVYSVRMLAWLRASEAWWARASQYWSVLPARPGLVSLLEQRSAAEPLVSVSRQVYGGGSGVQGRGLKEGYEAFESQVSVAHLETRMAAARATGSDGEYAAFARVYAEKVAMVGAVGKLEELCREVAGNRELLREVVLAVGKYREAQKVVSKYAVAVGVITDVDKV